MAGEAQAEAFEDEVEGVFDGLLGEAELGGDLGDGHLFDAAHLVDALHAVGERFDFAGDEGLEFAEAEEFFGGEVSLLELLDVKWAVNAFPGAADDALEDAVFQRGEQVCGEGVGNFDMLAVIPAADKDFLHRVLGVGIGAEALEGFMVQGLPVAVIEGTEGGLFVTRRQQHFIRCLFIWTRHSGGKIGNFFGRARADVPTLLPIAFEVSVKFFRDETFQLVPGAHRWFAIGKSMQILPFFCIFR